MIGVREVGTCALLFAKLAFCGLARPICWSLSHRKICSQAVIGGILVLRGGKRQVEYPLIRDGLLR